MKHKKYHMLEKQIICLNFGSTSSEVACLFPDGRQIRSKIPHGDEVLSLRVSDQIDIRKEAVLLYLEKEGVEPLKTDAFACRGGRLRPVSSGIYLVDDALIRDSLSERFGDHASRLSALVGAELAEASGCKAYVVDPISVDEMTEVARVSGLRGLERRSLGHFLNSKYVAQEYTREHNLDYQQVNLLVAHLGGGATISAHRKGKVVDLINDFEGAFSPDRSGALPNYELLNLCERLGFDRARKCLEGEGGLFSYTGNKDFSAFEQAALAGDSESRLLLDAYVYQQRKSIASMFSVLEFEAEALILTGGISHSKFVQEALFSMFSKFTSCIAYPGSFEVEALTKKVYLALQGDAEILRYPVS